MNDVITKPNPTMALPELSISGSMRTAARSVAATFHAYQAACLAMPQANGEADLAKLLKQQKETKKAYHLALKFLSTATLKENAAYDANAHREASEAVRDELQPLLQDYLDKRLNQLVAEEAAKHATLANQADNHPVMRGPW